MLKIFNIQLTNPWKLAGCQYKKMDDGRTVLPSVGSVISSFQNSLLKLNQCKHTDEYCFSYFYENCTPSYDHRHESGSWPSSLILLWLPPAWRKPKMDLQNINKTLQSQAIQYLLLFLFFDICSALGVPKRFFYFSHK